MFEMFPDMLATADADGSDKQLNSAWERTLGWSHAELLGFPIMDLVHPDDRMATTAAMGRMWATGSEAPDFETRCRCRDGSYRWLSWRATSDGYQWYVVARDVTERKTREADQLDAVTRLRALLVERTRELRSTVGAIEVAESEIVRRLSMAVEWRDDDTGQHIDRVSRFSSLLAQRAGLDPRMWEPIRLASPLHDAGKVAIPDGILLKPGKLTAQERTIMESHARLGYDLLRGSESATLNLAASIAWTHHEKYDGSGYPRGLVGDEIPIAGRIVAVVDVFDALTSDRVYRDAFTIEQALDMMRADRGTHFDPRLFDCFLEARHEMKQSEPLARAHSG
jgi:PAS domain S-box-containing protein